MFIMLIGIVLSLFLSLKKVILIMRNQNKMKIMKMKIFTEVKLTVINAIIDFT